MEILNKYAEVLPARMAHKRLQLKLLDGEPFRVALLAYAKPLIIKGVPPMLQSLKDLHTDSGKVESIGALLSSMRTCYQK